MQPSFLQRYLQSFHRIEGWFEFDAALLFMKYSQLAFKDGERSNVLEIGVHHGLSTIAIAALRGTGKQLTAIDLFEDQQKKNVSGSGSGDRGRFEKNMHEFYPDSSFVRVIARGSKDLTPADLGSKFTFSHIDGGHSPEEVYHDLKLCYDISADGGLIALDDYFNPEHPGVCEGAVEFSLRHPGWLRPLAAGYNKVLFQKPREAPIDLNSLFVRAFPNLTYRTVRLWKSPVILLGAPLREQVDLYASTPEDLVRFGSAGARARFTPSVKSLRARPGQQIDVEVKVENTSFEAFPAGEGVFGLSYHLLEHDNPRVWLSTSLAPRDNCFVRLAVTAPSKIGKYQIEIDLVWEGVMWFKDVGNPTAMVELSVV
ncbi:MAG: class I SAM-dependent methyltransferase [Bryobacteraceae bacterium]